MPYVQYYDSLADFFMCRSVFFLLSFYVCGLLVCNLFAFRRCCGGAKDGISTPLSECVVQARSA